MKDVNLSSSLEVEWSTKFRSYDPEILDVSDGKRRIRSPEYDARLWDWSGTESWIQCGSTKSIVIAFYYNRGLDSFCHLSTCFNNTISMISGPSIIYMGGSPLL